MSTEQVPFEGWFIVEQMGHKRMVGYVREQIVGGVPLLRVDVPGATLEDPPIATQFIHAATLYALTPTTEKVVRATAGRASLDLGMSSYHGRALGPGDMDVDDDDDQGEQTLDEQVDDLLTQHNLSTVLGIMRELTNGRAHDPETERQAAILSEACDLLTGNQWPASSVEASQK